MPASKEQQHKPAPAPTHKAAVYAEDFSWHYPGRKEPTLRQLNFCINPGEKVLLLGPSGAGKSTLLQAIAGLLEDQEDSCSSGSLLLAGQPAAEAGSSGLLQQDPEVSIVLSRLADDVAFGPENMGMDRQQIWRQVGQALAAVGLDHLPPNHPTAALSGGQKQRLGLAGLLAMQPQLLLLDEPTANLDPAGRLQVQQAVLAAQKKTGATLLLIEQRLANWAPHMDRVLVLDDQGRLSHDGPAEKIMTEHRQELLAAGIWLADYRPQTPAPSWHSGPTLLKAEELSLTRATPSRRQLRRRQKALAAGQPAQLELPLTATGFTCLVKAGQHLSIMGPNGSGKTTAALTLAGLLYPAKGQVLATEHLAADGSAQQTREVSGWTGAELVSRIGLVFQNPEQQFVCATVREELEFGPRQLAKSRGCAVDEVSLSRQTDSLLDRLALTKLAQANPFTLSGGQKRRLSVATALASAPRLLILDEPTFGQDARTWQQLVLLIHELLEQGLALVSVTHDSDFVEAVGGPVLNLAAPAGGGQQSQRLAWSE